MTDDTTRTALELVDYVLKDNPSFRDDGQWIIWKAAYRAFDHKLASQTSSEDERFWASVQHILDTVWNSRPRRGHLALEVYIRRINNYTST